MASFLNSKRTDSRTLSSNQSDLEKFRFKLHIHVNYISSPLGILLLDQKLLCSSLNIVQKLYGCVIYTA